MKKFIYVIFALIFFYSPSAVLAANYATTFDGWFEKDTLYEAKLIKLIDGDTATFDVFGHEYKVRFLFIDTPENTKEIEAFGQEATDYAERLLSSGTIYLEIDNGNVFDKYNRLLAWVWIDDKLLQTEMAKSGLVKGFYDYDDYKYEDEVRVAHEYAQKTKIGIYADNSSTSSDDTFFEDNGIFLAFIILAAIISYYKKRK